MIKVKINGKEEEIEMGLTVQNVLQSKDVKPEMVAVELNGDLLSKEEYDKNSLKEGDVIEFLYYMAGGNEEGIGYRVLVSNKVLKWT